MSVFSRFVSHFSHLTAISHPALDYLTIWLNKVAA